MRLMLMLHYFCDLCTLDLSDSLSWHLRETFILLELRPGSTPECISSAKYRSHLLWRGYMSKLLVCQVMYLHLKIFIQSWWWKAMRAETIPQN